MDFPSANNDITRDNGNMRRRRKDGIRCYLKFLNRFRCASSLKANSVFKLFVKTRLGREGDCDRILDCKIGFLRVSIGKWDLKLAVGLWKELQSVLLKNEHHQEIIISQSWFNRPLRWVKRHFWFSTDISKKFTFSVKQNSFLQPFFKSDNFRTSIPTLDVNNNWFPL